MTQWSYDVGPIRPPSEAMSLLVRLTRNCPWNRCRFCVTYKGFDFAVRPLDEVCGDIDAMARIARLLFDVTRERGAEGRLTQGALEQVAEMGVPIEYAHQVALFLSRGGQNVFLQDGNSLEAPTEIVTAVLQHVYERFPSVTRVTTYARSMTLAKLGAEKLAAVRQAGLTRVHVGLESGCDAVLKLIRKGVLAKHHIAGGRAAIEAGLELSEYVMPGVGGREWSAAHARDTAATLNAIDPHFIRLRSFYPIPGCGLDEDLEAGTFSLMDEDEIVREIRSIVDGLEGIGSYFVSDHDRNLLMDVEGRLPDDKAAMLAVIDRYLGLPDDERQLFRIGRRLGYFVHLDDLESPLQRPPAKQAQTELAQRFGDADEGLRQVAQVRL